MLNARPIWSRCIIGAHLLVVVVSTIVLAQLHSDWGRFVLSFVSGTSLFVLTSLVHEASHYNLARSVWLNDVLGSLAGNLLATPVSAYRCCT